MAARKTNAKLAESFNLVRKIAMILFATVMMVACFVPANAASLPSDDEEEVLIRTTLMTFNDANMTGNYSVLLAKASKEVQAQLSNEKLFEAFKPFRTNQLFFEDVIYEELDSYDDSKFDDDGALVLAGVIRTDTKKISYTLKFLRNDNVWKWSGINVKADKLR